MPKSGKTRRPRALLVVGSPRSGTTMMGRLLGSSPQVLDLGEYYGHYFARVKAPDAYRRVPTDRASEFLTKVRELAINFPEQLAATSGADYYIDASPWNLLIAAELAADLPEAVFIVMLRSWAGVCQSLERSYDMGYEWAGATTGERAAVWADLYGHVSELPAGRTLAVSYDRLCENPAGVLGRFTRTLAELGLPHDLDASILSTSHANGESPREVLGHRAPTGLALKGRRPYDIEAWTAADEAAAKGAASDVAACVKDRFPVASREGVQVA